MRRVLLLQRVFSSLSVFLSVADENEEKSVHLSPLLSLHWEDRCLAVGKALLISRHISIAM